VTEPLVALSAKCQSKAIDFPNLYMKTSGSQANMSLPRFLTVEEVAEMLRVKPRTIYDWVSQRRVPFRKAGDRTVFLLEEILEWTKADEAA